MNKRKEPQTAQTAASPVRNTTFCVQVKPDLAPELDITQVKTLAAALALDKSLVSRHGVVEGKSNDEGGGPYINLMYETLHARALWEIIDNKLYGNASWGNLLASASMVICTGDEGWDDLFLLHHYDPEQEVDSADDLT